jgi:hypothetical protein
MKDSIIVVILLALVAFFSFLILVTQIVIPVSAAIAVGSFLLTISGVLPTYDVAFYSALVTVGSVLAVIISVLCTGILAAILES